jgi:N-acetylglucosaminyldiphosphoundecaprenol N-acetyl-beta-D-mannosaminyltransferase
MEILGVKISEFKLDEALNKVAEVLESEKQYKIFTPNPEMLVDAQSDVYFKEVLNEGDLNICDGKGIELVSKGKLMRIPGVDFMLQLCKLAEQKKYSIYFLGSGSADTIEQVTLNIQKQFPHLKISGGHEGPKIMSELKNDRMILNMIEEENNEIISNIVMKSPDILFVAFGHGKQEKWIYEHLRDLPSVKVAMGVGGAFDFISGNKKRAPKWMRDNGVEWMYRLVQEPERFERIWKATFRFLCIFFKNYVTQAFRHERN